MNVLRTGAVLCAFLVFAACVPMGGIGGSDEVETFWIVPKRLNYETSVPFSRTGDLTVYGFLDGEVVIIPIEAVDIGIVENPSAPNSIYWVPDGEWVVESDKYWWNGTGEKIIVINYQSMSERYTINVNNPGSGPPPGGNDGDWEIIIVWG